MTSRPASVQTLQALGTTTSCCVWDGVRCRRCAALRGRAVAQTSTSRCPRRRWPGSTASCGRSRARTRCGREETKEPSSTSCATRGSWRSTRRSARPDFSYEVRGLSRFRVNAFRQRGHVSIALRAIPFQVRTVADLGLPPVIRKLAEQPRGIILLTGTTGSGKSTTLAAMIDHINSTRARHMVTLEDPIEYLHRDKLSIINQREVGHDTESFARAMRRVLRQDPDVILIGEMRDEETVRTALAAAETGHLVLSTLHTLDATETINRIVDFFPPHLQQQARVMLASTLRGVVGQRLVQRAEGQRARRRLRGDRRHRARSGPDPQPAGDRAHDRGDLGGRVLRHADVRPGAAQARAGRKPDRGSGPRGRLQPARLQADARRRGAARERNRAGRGGRFRRRQRRFDPETYFSS